MPINKILVVDDEADVQQIAAHFLRSKWLAVSTASDGVEALSMAQADPPDLVLLDIFMPGKDGITCLKELKQLFPETEVIMATASHDIGTAVTCLQNGAYGYIVKPFDFDLLYQQVSKALEHRAMQLKINEFHDNLEKMVNERTQEVQELNKKLRANFLVSIKILLSLLEVYDPYLGSHLKRVGALALEMGRTMKLKKEEREELEIAALLHDIGRVALPDEQADTKFHDLPGEQVSQVKQHTIIAQSILSPNEQFENVGRVIRSLHEHLDGTGFPDNLRDEHIPYHSRILGVINAFDELTHRRRFTNEQIGKREEREAFAFRHLYSMAGRHYQRDIIEALEMVVQDIRRRVRNELRLAVKDLQPGMMLAADIYTRDGLLLLGSGNKLNAPHIKRIETFCHMGMVKDEFFVANK